MSDSNEMNTNPKHPRLRVSQSGIAAQKARDEGEPLTTESYADIMNNVLLDVLNERIDRGTAMTAIAAGNQIIQAAKLELQNREMYYRYQYKYEQSMEAPQPLALAAKQKKQPATLKRKAS